MNSFLDQQIIELFGIVEHLEKTLFKNFLQLNILRLFVQNLRRVFSKNRQFWKYLNNKYKVNNSMEINRSQYIKNSFYLEIDETWRISIDMSLSYIMSGYYSLYLYTDVDFCLFKEFPQDKLIEAKLPMVELKVIFKISVTVLDSALQAPSTSTLFNSPG